VFDVEPMLNSGKVIDWVKCFRKGVVREGGWHSIHFIYDAVEMHEYV
jgi:hypothetical protein